MKNNDDNTLLSKSIKEQQILRNDERFISINEKASNSVSKIMNYILVALLFSSAYIRNFTVLFVISILIIIKLVLTLFYFYYYNKKI